MKKIVSFIFCALLIAILTVTWLQAGESAVPQERPKVLIVYYSLTDTTANVAGILREKTGGDTWRIEPTPQYSSATVGNEMAAERKDGMIRELNGPLPDLSACDVILVGGPAWSGFSNPVQKYLSQTDFGGKKVSGFWTASANPGKYADEFRDRVRNGATVDGLSLIGSEISNKNGMNAKIDAWLKTLGL